VLSIDEVINEIQGATVKKRAISAPEVLNEACEYGSAFSRGTRVDLNALVILFISGTASVDEAGRTLYPGDLRKQCQRTFLNITKLLEAEGATWKDMIRTTCYLRDIDRDYAEFNDERTRFYDEQGLKPYPASTGIQAKLCRSDLLVEIEAIAMFKKPAEEKD
jgi:enamine deaminase RidA (YjgF/YER057c/UK114 family)